MRYSENSRIGDLIKNDAAKAVLEKFIPGFTASPQLSVVNGFTLRAISNYPNSLFTPELLNDCIEELAKIEVSDTNKIIVNSAQGYQREGYKEDIRWGIIGPGNIANQVAKAIEGTKGSVIYAVASHTKDKAEAFAKLHHVQKICGSYEELAEDPMVDVVYIANLKTQHFDAAKLMLNTGKAVLCEKPMTINTKQAQELILLSQKKQVFLMEAMWMRYNPNIIKLLEWIKEGKIGRVREIEADFSYECEPNSSLLFPEFGGGALLDLGIYPITLAKLIMGKLPDSSSSECILTSTGVDGRDRVTMLWNTGEKARLSFGITELGDMSAKVIGTEGYIEVSPCFHATQGLLISNTNGIYEYSVPFRINGYEYEVEEVMRCLDSGLIESPNMSHEDTLKIIRYMDDLRSQWGLAYPVEQEESLILLHNTEQ